MALNAQILISILAHETSSDGLGQTVRATPASYAKSLTDGTGENQSQVVWSDSRTSPQNSIDDLDLTSLDDDRGTVAFSAVKAVYIRNTHASGQLEVRQGDGIANSWSGLGYADESGVSDLTVPPGGCVFLSAPSAAGITVNSGQRILRIVGTGVTYDIVLIGEGTVT